MRLCEADGKTLLGGHGIAVPSGIVLAMGAAPVPGMATESVVKAQLLSSGRGKGGLVSIGHADLHAAIAAVRSRMEDIGSPPVVLVEERLAIAAEYYLALVLDDVTQLPQVLFSARGGVSVEDEAEHVRRHPIDPARGPLSAEAIPFFRAAGAAPGLLNRLARLAADLYRVMLAEDAELIEINPLVVTAEGRLVAADAKIVLDDSAAFRHPRRVFAWSALLEDAEQSLLEREAVRDGFTFVEMPGDVAMMTAGAGLGMMVIDLLADAGFRPACFFDNAVSSRRDTTEERLRLAFRRAEAADVRAILFYQTLATRDLKPRIDALVALLDAAPPPKPLYFGLSASYVAERQMTAAEARALMERRGFPAEADPGRLVARMKADRDAGRLAA